MGSKEQRLEITVGEMHEKIRLDAYLSQQGLKRSVLSENRTSILLNGKLAKKGKPVKTGDVISVTYTEESFGGLVPQDIPLKILHEDEHLLVIDKQQGMVVHPAVGNHEGTVVNALLFRYGMEYAKIFSHGYPVTPDERVGEAGMTPTASADKEARGNPKGSPKNEASALSDTYDGEEEYEGEAGEISLDSPLIRPGIVHRLDKDTSGTLLIARTQKSYLSLSEQFKAHSTTKTYIALCKGNFSRVEGSIQTNIKRDARNRKRFVTCSGEEGRSALTHYRVLRQFSSFALVRINIHTGRTHQIRVHFSSLGHPIVGDVIYGKEDGTTLMLHALELAVDHPDTGERVAFRSGLPPRFMEYVRGERR